METNPVSGRPAEEAVFAAAAEEVRGLQKQAQFLDAVETAEGQKILKVVEDHLVKRIEALVAEDPAAKAYMGLITTFRGKIAVAQVAREKLLRK